jgi:hypothetical protein
MAVPRELLLRLAHCTDSVIVSSHGRSSLASATPVLWRVRARVHAGRVEVAALLIAVHCARLAVWCAHERRHACAHVFHGLHTHTPPHTHT